MNQNEMANCSHCRVCYLLIVPSAVHGENACPVHAQAAVENWDKGRRAHALGYTHISEVFPAAIVRRAGPIVELTAEVAAGNQLAL